MRRLIIELSREEISKFRGGEKPFKNIKSLEIIHYLRRDNEELAGIFRIELEKPDFTVNDLLVNGSVIEAQMLEKENDGKSIVFIKSKPQTGSSGPNLVDPGKGYLVLPPEIQGDKFRLTFFGSPKEVTEFMRKIQQRGLYFKIILIANANFSSELLSALTEKQKKVIVTAYRMGYYDFPRKINTKQLSQKLNLHSSAFVAHRRKAERRLLAQIIKD